MSRSVPTGLLDTAIVTPPAGARYLICCEAARCGSGTGVVGGSRRTMTDIDIKSLVRTIPDYPKPGIMFRDITTLLGDAKGLTACIDLMAALLYARQGRRGGCRHRGARLYSWAAPWRTGWAAVSCRSARRASCRARRSARITSSNTAPISSRYMKTASGRARRCCWWTTLSPPAVRRRRRSSCCRKLGAEIVGASFVIDLPELKGLERLVEALGMSNVTRADRIRGGMSALAGGDRRSRTDSEISGATIRGLTVSMIRISSPRRGSTATALSSSSRTSPPNSMWIWQTYYWPLYHHDESEMLMPQWQARLLSAARPLRGGPGSLLPSRQHLSSGRGRGSGRMVRAV